LKKEKGTSTGFLKKRDPDVLETRKGGGCLTLFGLPFLLAGLFVMQIPLQLIPVEVEGDPQPWYFFVLFSIPFVAAGAGMVFGRAGVIIDRRTKTVTRWWGLLIPIRRRKVLLDPFRRVTLKKETSDDSTTYPVSLDGAPGEQAVALCSSGSYEDARAMAEELAEFLDRPLADATSGKFVIREAGDLDESVREQVKRTGEEVELPPAPFEMRTRIERTGDSVILDIPGPRFSFLHLIPMMAPVGIAAYMGFKILPGVWEIPGPDIIRYIFTGFIGIFFVLLPLVSGPAYFIKSVMKKTRVVVSRSALRVEEGKGRKMKVTEIPVDEIEELVLPTTRSVLDTMEIPGGPERKELGDTGTPRLPDGRPMPNIFLFIARLAGTRGITARSDRMTVRFGRGLPGDELKFIHATIMKAMTD
jgi:hypothetical protein